MMQTMSGQMDLGDGMLAYEVAGAGMPVVLVHAAFLDRRMFDPQWETLAREFQVIRFDMMGFGASSPATGPRSRRADVRRLLDHLRIDRAHWVGCSMGGEMLLDLALEQPERAASLTVIGSTPSGFELHGAMPRYMGEMIGALQTGAVATANELQIRIWFDGQFREPDQVNAEQRAQALAMNRIPVERNTFAVADMQPLNPLDPPAVGRLDAVRCPTLIVAGALDHPEIVRAAEVMAQGIPHARQAIIDGAAHVPSFERPEVFNPLLLEFLRQQRA
jgi:pimeloyl-ACP methyl ester carboxylesterase